MAQAPQGFLFDLADALAGELEVLADFLKGEKFILDSLLFMDYLATAEKAMILIA